MRRAASRAKHRPQNKAIPHAEQHTICDAASESPQRPMLAAQQVIRQIQRSQHVKRTTNNADEGNDVLVHGHSFKEHAQDGRGIKRAAQELASFFLALRRAAAPFALLRNTRKTVAVSSAPPKS